MISHIPRSNIGGRLYFTFIITAMYAMLFHLNIFHGRRYRLLLHLFMRNNTDCALLFHLGLPQRSNKGVCTREAIIVIHRYPRWMCIHSSRPRFTLYLNVKKRLVYSFQSHS